MRRPRLTKRIIHGLDYAHRELSVTIDARHGWDDYYAEDGDVEKALDYIEALLWWWEGRKCPHHRKAHAKGRPRSG